MLISSEDQMMVVVVVVVMGVVMVMLNKVDSGRGTAAAILADPNLSQDQVQCQHWQTVGA